MNRAAARLPLVADGGPPRCPACGGVLEFGSDREGRMTERCACGHWAYVVRREGRKAPDTPA